MENKITNIEKLALSGKKVFTIQDLAAIWQLGERRRLVERIKYYLREKRLVPITKGVYAYGPEYTAFDIAQKLVPLSYLSLYTTSQLHGLTFQYYQSIFSIALRSKKYMIRGQEYRYHKIKEQIFFNQMGLLDNGNYTYADKERTVCDCLYVFPGFSFDNLRGINTERLLALAPIYQNKRLEQEVAAIIPLINNQS